MQCQCKEKRKERDYIYKWLSFYTESDSDEQQIIGNMFVPIISCLLLQAAVQLVMVCR